MKLDFPLWSFHQSFPLMLQKTVQINKHNMSINKVFYHKKFTKAILCHFSAVYMQSAKKKKKKVQIHLITL